MPIPSQNDVVVCYIRDMDNSSIFRTSANVRERLFFHNRPETRMNTKCPFLFGIVHRQPVNFDGPPSLASWSCSWETLLQARMA